MKAVLVLLALAISTAYAADWAVIVAGSNQFYNYRHQADACHAYQIVAKNGISADNTIMMYYDDIAGSSENPFPGQIFNKPTAAGTPGVDVYSGCQKDYVGDAVTARNFLNVITGVPTTGGNGKVLKSNATDNVFIFFVDHGGTGIIAFPVGPYLQASDLNKALATMQQKKMYNKLVFYVEACESGSMFEGILPTNMNIYVTTASNADESSWGTYCPPDDMVNGKEIGSCLGDLYSVNWMENTDSVGMSETLQQQYVVVKQQTTQSHVMQYGDQSFVQLPIGAFLANQRQAIEAARFSGHRTPKSTDVRSRDIPMHSAYYAYLRAGRDGLPLAAQHEAAQRLLDEVTRRVNADKLFMSLALNFAAGAAENLFTAPAPLPVTEFKCFDAVNAALQEACGGYTDYSIQYARVVMNVCAANKHAAEATQSMIAHVRAACAA